MKNSPLITVASVFLLLSCNKKTMIEVVNSDSMSPTIKKSQSIEWNAIEQNNKYNKGEIVIIKSPVSNGKWARRIIGVGGDEITLQDSGIILNGKFTSWVEITNKSSSKSKKIGQKILIPNNHVYLIGDNLNNSRDSREFGPISESFILGKFSRVINSRVESSAAHD